MEKDKNMRKKKMILIEDDCAPDAIITFEKEFKKETGFSIKEFIKISEIVSDGDESIWRHGIYELSISADHQFYTLEKSFIPFRFSLRNQKKIEAHYDKETLDRILSSLKEGFESYSEIELHKAKPYQLTSVNDIGHTSGIIVFHVISITYDVYLLAFKEFIS